MPTNTELGIPVPEDTDPLASVYQYQRDMAEFLDELILISPTEGPVNNSTTLVPSPGFTFTAKDGKAYAFELHLVFDTTVSNCDVRMAMQRSALCDLTWSAVGTAPSFGGIGDVATGAIYHGTSGDILARGLSNGKTAVHLYGTVYANQGVDADITLAWAQNTAQAANLYLRDGSYMKVKVIP